MYARQTTNEEQIEMQLVKEAFEEEERQKREDRIYCIKHKLLGVLSLITGIVAPLLLDGDLTVTVLMVSAGLVLINTTEREG
jgi:hypothetical protein